MNSDSAPAATPPEEVWVPPTRPAETLTGAGLRLDRWRPESAPELTEHVAVSRDHLIPWMPWAQDTDPGAALTFIEETARNWESRTTFGYRIGHPGTGELLGSAGLMARQGPRCLEIGYWVTIGAVRQRVATRATALLTVTGLSLPEVDRIVIHHDTANVASGGVPRVLGFRHVDDYPHDVGTPGGSGTFSVWEMTAADLPDWPQWPDLRAAAEPR